MSLMSSHTVTTRISDLDSLRHVNNRKYEQFCADGRYRLLEEHGYPLETLLEKATSLCPVATHVKFLAQQKSGATLKIETVAYPMEDGIILWDHNVQQTDGKLVCHLQAKTRTIDRRRSPVELLPATRAQPEQVLIEEVPGFSGNCARVSNAFAPIYTDMDTFGNLPIAAWWRIYEEGRHMAGDQLGLTLGSMLQFDTHLFWVAGTYHFYRIIQPGQQLAIYTWLERIVRIRAYIRQEIRSEDGADLLGASREEHLIVSLANSKPKAMPYELAERLQGYVECPE